MERFFTSEACLHDVPVRGAAAYARRAHGTGVQLVYLTARPERMRPGTEEVLRRFGFPLPGPGVQLWMKPDDPSVDDEAFKRSAHARLASLGRLVAAFDNEPGHVNDFRDDVPRGRGGAGRHRPLGPGVNARPPGVRGAPPGGRARSPRKPVKPRRGAACPDRLENRASSRYGRPRMAPAYSKDLLLSMYRNMYLIRRFEERAAQAYGQGKINGFCHLYIGQEAVAVGATEALRPDDYLIAAYRDHGYALTRGADPGMVMAELFGRATGYSKGKGGSMHIFDVEHYMLGGYGIVGGQIPLAAGLAFASRYRNDDRVTVCYFGEAAANQGAFHETLNMAAKWKLPVIFLCENNRYGMGTAIARVSPVPEIYKRAAAYEMRGEPVDGMDVLKVYEAVKDCAAHCRAGQGPGAARGQHLPLPRPLDVRRGHLPDQGRGGGGAQGRPHPQARASAAVEQRRSPEAEFDAIDAEVKATVDAAVKFADESPEPSLDELHEDIFVEPGERGRAAARARAGDEGGVAEVPRGAGVRVTWDLEPREQAEVAEQKAGLKKPARA